MRGFPEHQASKHQYISPGVNLSFTAQSNREMVSTSNFGNVSVFDEVDQLGQFRAFHSSSSQLTKLTITPRPHVAYGVYHEF